jgi:hypothetical protein
MTPWCSMKKLSVVKYYPYRTGYVHGVQIPREIMRGLEEQLCKESQVGIDNHVCFSIIDTAYKPFAVMFHDFTCVIGENVEERKW